MSQILPFIAVGLVSGSVYALAGVGLVLTYKTSGVFNFAYGAFAAISAYVFYTLMVSHNVPWSIAAAIAVFVVGAVTGLCMAKLAQVVRDSGLVINVGSTIGILLLVEAVIELMYGNATYRNVPVFLGAGTVNILDTTVQWSSIVTFLIGVVATALLAVYLRVTRMGIAMRAVVDDAELLDTSGISPNRVRRLSWIIGCTFAAASGVLFAPLLPLDPTTLTLLVISAFGAAAIGAFRNLPLTFFGGLIIGVVASILTRYLTTGLLAGVPPSLPFLVLFVLLVVYPNRGRWRLPVVSERIAQRSAIWKPPGTFTLSIGLAVLIVLILAPQFTGLHLMDWASALATTILFLSLSLLVRTSGQLSLCQVGFAAIGAAAFSHLTTGLGIPWLPALLISAAFAVPIGALLAIPAIRLSGVYLALATFGFGIVLQSMFYSQSYMFGSHGAGLVEPRPHVAFLSSDTGFYYLVLACALVTAGVLMAIDRSRLGRLLRGVADAPTTLRTSGASINVTRVLVFCISAFLAAGAGALAATAQSPASADNYPPLLSLTYLAAIIVIGQGAPWNALIAGFAVVLVPAYIHSTTVSWILQAVFGGSLVLLALTPEPMRHMPDRVSRAIDRVFPRWRGRGGAAPAPGHAASPASSGPGESLELSGIRVQFGGLVAVKNLSLAAPAGTITGLIGPNGAGKTTTFNVCSGLVRANAGRVLLDGHSLVHIGPAARARRGLGRTFQRLELFDSLSVRDNVALGAEAPFASDNPLLHLVARRAQARLSAASVAAAIELCGLSEVAEAPVSTLSTGRRRLVDLARCLAGRPRILLLDEPSSGLDAAETDEFAGIIRRVVKQSGVGVLLVEHDLSLVLGICSSIYVLDFGELLFHGTPDEVVASPVVQSAYLGEPSSDLPSQELAGQDVIGELQ